MAETLTPQRILSAPLDRMGTDDPQALARLRVVPTTCLRGVRVADRTCTVDDCNGKHLARGLCNRHYKQASLTDTLPPPVDDLADPANVIDGEQWRPIPGFEGYEASDHGRIVSRHLGARHLLRPHICKRWGYLRVHISRRGTIKVHVLVALAFHGPRPAGLHTRHRDGNKLDNTPGNLAYGTPTQNNRDVVRHGGHQQANKTHCPAGHPYDEANTPPHAAGRTNLPDLRARPGEGTSSRQGDACLVVHPECLAELIQLLRADAEQLMIDADKAHRTPRLKIHENTLRHQAHGLNTAIAYLRQHSRQAAP